MLKDDIRFELRSVLSDVGISEHPMISLCHVSDRQCPVAIRWQELYSYLPIFARHSKAIATLIGVAKCRESERVLLQRAQNAPAWRRRERYAFVESAGPCCYK